MKVLASSQTALLSRTSTKRFMRLVTRLASRLDIVDTPPTEAASDPAKLGWILIRNRWISAAQLQASLTAQIQVRQNSPQKLGELLLSGALITEGQLKQALREQYWRRNGYWVI